MNTNMSTNKKKIRHGIRVFNKSMRRDFARNAWFYFSLKDRISKPRGQYLEPSIYRCIYGDIRERYMYILMFTKSVHKLLNSYEDQEK